MIFLKWQITSVILVKLNVEYLIRKLVSFTFVQYNVTIQIDLINFYLKARVYIYQW